METGYKAFPLLSELMSRPHVDVSYVGYGDLSTHIRTVDSSNLLIDIDNGFSHIRNSSRHR